MNHSPQDSTKNLNVPVFPLNTGHERAKRVLLIAYNFPPVGGAGVQRPVKWTKYLRRFGWNVTVLTTENPSVPVRDESLLAEVPHDVPIIRARTLEPDYSTKQNLALNQGATSRGVLSQAKNAAKGLVRRVAKLALQPDPQVLWNRNAIRAGIKALKEIQHDAILVTAPAYSSFLIGAKLKRTFGLPLILDYRDEWDLSGKYLENAQRDWYSRLVQDRMQKSLLRQADAVIATTQASTSNLANKLTTLHRNIPAICIYNGFDADDFLDHPDIESRTVPETPLINALRKAGENQTPIETLKALDTDSDLTIPAIPPKERNGRGSFQLLYTGTLWNLTDISPVVQAIELVQGSHPELLRRLKLTCVGRKTPEQQQWLDRAKATAARVELTDYCDHSRVLKYLRSADALCLLLSDVPGAERVVPAKLFEYLAIRKEILTVAPAGEAATIATQFFPHSHFVPGNVSGIADWLVKQLQRDGESSSIFEEDGDIETYSRESQTARLVELLNRLVTKPE